VSAGLAVPEGRFELGMIRTERKPTRFKLSHNISWPSTASCRWKVAFNRASNPESDNPWTDCRSDGLTRFTSQNAEAQVGCLG